MNQTDDGCLASWCSEEEWCEITCAAEILGKKWHPVIVHRLLERGPLGFNALQDAIGDISSNVLSNSLEGLEDNGVVDRDIVSEKPFRVEYSLTEQGEALAPVIDAMSEWGREYLSAEE